MNSTGCSFRNIEEQLIERLCKKSAVIDVIRNPNFIETTAQIYNEMSVDERNRIRAIPDRKERIQEIRKCFSPAHQNLIQERETEEKLRDEAEFIAAFYKEICSHQDDLED
jgi:hypothetical protein